MSKYVKQFQEVNTDELDKVLANEIAAGVRLEKRTSLLCVTCFESESAGISPQPHLP